MARILGLDWGEKRVGVATADVSVGVAVGCDVWPTREVLPRLAVFSGEETIRLVVVGYPLTLRGEAGPQAREVDRFVAMLKREGYRVRRWDERYTTQSASRALSRWGISQRKQRGRVDMAAAILMLQSFLDEGGLSESDEENRGG